MFYKKQPKRTYLLQRSVKGRTKVFIDRWPLFGASETTYPIFTGRIKTGICGQSINVTGPGGSSETFHERLQGFQSFNVTFYR